MDVALFAPKEYGFQPCSFHTATHKMIDEVTGGCGPGGFGDFLVPDKILGVSVKPPCVIHDWMYFYGETEEQKERADKVFRTNMVRIVTAHTKSRIMLKLRLPLVQTYYWFVKTFGAAAFYANVNTTEEVQVVRI